MGGSLNYEKDRYMHQKFTIKSDAERVLEEAGKFPSCRGLFPDCPIKPSKKNPMCVRCPKLDE